jgi:hypothetical protein
MTKLLAAWIFFSAAGCATTRPAPERLSAPDPRHGVPPTSAEADPGNTEQRFGFAEAKARQEAKVPAAQAEPAGCLPTDVPYPCTRATHAH